VLHCTFSAYIVQSANISPYHPAFRYIGCDGEKIVLIFVSLICNHALLWRNNNPWFDSFSCAKPHQVPWHELLCGCVYLASEQLMVVWSLNAICYHGECFVYAVVTGVFSATWCLRDSFLTMMVCWMQYNQELHCIQRWQWRWAYRICTSASLCHNLRTVQKQCMSSEDLDVYC